MRSAPRGIAAERGEAGAGARYALRGDTERARRPLLPGRHHKVATVTASRPLVTEPANTVETILTISVDRQRDTSAPRVVEVREQGGVVSVAQVPSDFEGKPGRKPTDKKLAETVDYECNGIEHAQVGDRVLVVVADDTSVQKKGAYVSVARQVQEDTASAVSKSASAKSSSTKFTWPGEAPNPAWENEVDAESLL
ncbi:hypothetical protein [Streptomyces sviceus]|uniref:hypothetical protein n=1 Tax=Streptomyces sviceus TaxID=285530 RepID=UPI00367A0133